MASIAVLPQCRSRVVRALGTGPDGTALLLPRFLAPTPLPPCLQELAAQVRCDLLYEARSVAVSSGFSLHFLLRSIPAILLPVLLLLLLYQFLLPKQLPAGMHGGAATSSDAMGSTAAQAPDALMLAAARWVAHLPLLDAGSLGAQPGGLWCSSADALTLGGGGHEEHAHLLAGLFMQLHQEVSVTPLLAEGCIPSVCERFTAFCALDPACTCHMTAAQAFVVLGIALTGAQAAFVLTTGRCLQQAAKQEATLRQPEPIGHSAAGTSPAQAPPLMLHPAQHPATAAGAQAAAVAAQHFDVAALRLWNPLSGLCVPVRDPSCQLREVHARTQHTLARCRGGVAGWAGWAGWAGYRRQ